MKIKNLAKRIIEKTGYSVIKKDREIGYIAWAKDNQFESSAESARPFTLLGKDRLFTLWQFAKQARSIEGAVAQVGVFKGGSAILVASALEGSGKPFYIFDTFEGMPEVDASVDMHKKGDFKNTSLEEVKKLFAGVSSAVFCPGFFPATTISLPEQKFSFVYIDVDIYTSVRDSLSYFYPKMTQGGFMIFDDYMGKHTPGVKKALDEFLSGKKEMPIITAIGQCVLIKQ